MVIYHWFTNKNLDTITWAWCNAEFQKLTFVFYSNENATTWCYVFIVSISNYSYKIFSHLHIYFQPFRKTVRRNPLKMVHLEFVKKNFFFFQCYIDCVRLLNKNYLFRPLQMESYKSDSEQINQMWCNKLLEAHVRSYAEC